MYIIFVLNIWICRNSKVNWAHYMYEMSWFSVRNFWICRKIKYPKLRKFNGKLCTLYTYETFGFAEKLNVQYCGNSMGNSVHYMYVMSGFVEKLNVLNSINSTENYLHYTYGMFGFEEKLIVIAAQILWEIVYIIRTECLNL